ncbi:MAG: hypothetical protein AAF512_24945 [Pseudomonadota bacterium]
MPLQYIALITGLLPLIFIHAVYLIAANTGYVDWCVPHLDGCTSISKTGREGLGHYVFKATIIPTSVFMMFYWLLLYQWLLKIGDSKSLSNQSLPWLGVLAGIFLIIYATALGTDGDFYRNLRRYGIIVFFSATFFAQLLTTWRISQVLKRTPGAVPRPIFNIKLGFATGQFFIGLVHLYGEFRLEGEAKDLLVNILEWNVTVLIMAYPIATYFAWRATGFKASLTVARGSG